jgi:hypothetical protein
LYQLIKLSNRAIRSFLDGDLDEAGRLVSATAPGAQALGWDPLVWSGPALLSIRRLQARDAELLTLVELVPRTGSFALVRFLVAAARARTGSPSDARAVLADLRADAFEMVGGHGWSTAMSELAEAAEVVGDADAAAHVLAQCGGYSGWISWVGSFVDRPFDQTLAQAALAAGDSKLAERYASEAVTASRQRRTPLYLARELVFLAEARVRNGASKADVAPIVAEARALAERFGTPVVTVDIERYGLAR